MTPIPYSIKANGEAALTVEFELPVSQSLSEHIIALAEAIKSEFEYCLEDAIPAFQSITVIFNPLIISVQEFETKLTIILNHPVSFAQVQPQIVSIPVCYGGKFGPDLEPLCQHKQISQEQFIELHTAPQYLVHMLGFTPGFLYLGGLNAKLNFPRKSTPALKVSAGSVGIGGGQTGIYPLATPGGWQIIGRTPLALFKPDTAQPFIARPLDKIQFVAINEAEFKQIARKHS
ncbi:5-oxoprolinase subunit PxpB [Aliikangiella sp. IMCC44653]